MRIEENDNGLYLFVDIDDFLVKSSPLIQRQVNEKTGFKTETLSMLEQTKRNCSYYYKHVAEECTNAFLERRMPNLDDFLLEGVGFKKRNPFYFSQLTEEEKETLYNKTIQLAEAYLEVADKIYNQFLEERDTFLEIDNLAFGQMKDFDYKRESEAIAYFAQLLKKFSPGLMEINRFCVDEIKRIVKEAEDKNAEIRKIVAEKHAGVLAESEVKDDRLIIPEYGDLVRMDSNDIIKTNTIFLSSDKEYVLYKKPIEKISSCFERSSSLYDIITNSDFYRTPSATLIDYDSIYQRCNVNYDAVILVEELLNSGRFTGAFAITHHNGPREMQAKSRLISELLPQLGFIGLRFHSEEHNAKRRSRSSKIDKVIALGFNPLYSALLDDSSDNCTDWKKKKGQEVLYKPQTDSEIINGVMERIALERITNFNVSVVLEIIDEKIASLRKAKQKAIGVRKNG